MRPSLEMRRKEAQRRNRISLGILAGGLLGIGALAVLLRPKPAPPPESESSAAKALPVASAVPPARPDDLGIADPTGVGPLDILGRAKTRALGWDSEAKLVRMTATPVSEGKVDLTADGRIEFLFGKPTGRGFGPGAHVKPKGFAVRVDGSGTSAEERALPTTRAATEPNCTLAEVARALAAAGADESAPLDVSYEFSSRHDRAVWKVNMEGEAKGPRFVDGWTCAIVVR